MSQLDTPHAAEADRNQPEQLVAAKQPDAQGYANKFGEQTARYERQTNMSAAQPDLQAKYRESGKRLTMEAMKSAAPEALQLAKASMTNNVNEFAKGLVTDVIDNGPTANADQRLLQAAKNCLWQQQGSDLNRFMQDPALSLLPKIESLQLNPALLPPNAKATPRDKSQAQLLIARELQAAGVANIDQATVDKVTGELLAARQDNADVQLLKGRNVLFAANSELGKDGSARFGKAATLQAIQNMSGKVEFTRSAPEREVLLTQKQNILDGIKNTPPPFTFVFDGHGLEDTIYLSGKDANGKDPDKATAIGITAQEFAAALKERSTKYPVTPADKNTKDIFIFANCYGHDFAQAVAAAGGSEVRDFLQISEAERGQQGFDAAGGQYGSDFLKHTILQVDGGKGAPSFGAAMLGEGKQKSSNPSFFAFKPGGGSMQLM